MPSQQDDDWEDEDVGAQSNGAVADDDEDDDDLAGHAVMQVRTTLMNVKKAAIVALGNIAEFTDGALRDHLAAALEVLKQTANYFHYEIRERSALALGQLAHAACVAGGGDMRTEAYKVPGAAATMARQIRKEPNAIEWTKGDGSAQLPDPMLQRFVDECVNALLHLLVEDTSKTVVAHACEALGDLLGDVGPAALNSRGIVDNDDKSQGSQLDRLCKVLLDLANGTAPCQTLLNADDADDELRAAVPGAENDDDDGDHDNVLMDNVADLCGSLAKTAGGLLGIERSDALFQAFSKYVMPSRSALDRAMAVGCYAELCHELPPDMAANRHFATLHPLFTSACNDSHSSVTRNGAFGVGALFAAATQLARPHFHSALQTLSPLLERAKHARDESRAADTAAADNAVASMCRIAMADVDATPIDQLLAVILPLLPLLEDPGENKTVFQCLLSLIKRQHPCLNSHLPELRRAFNDVLQQDKLQDQALRSEVAQASHLLTNA